MTLDQPEIKCKLLYQELVAGLLIYINNLSGKIMTQVEACISDPEQRIALKIVLKNIIWSECDNIKNDMSDVVLQFGKLIGVKSQVRFNSRKIDFEKVLQNETNSEKKE